MYAAHSTDAMSDYVKTMVSNATLKSLNRALCVITGTMWTDITASLNADNPANLKPIISAIIQMTVGLVPTSLHDEQSVKIHTANTICNAIKTSANYYDRIVDHVRSERTYVDCIPVNNTAFARLWSSSTFSRTYSTHKTQSCALLMAGTSIRNSCRTINVDDTGFSIRRALDSKKGSVLFFEDLYIQLFQTFSATRPEHIPFNSERTSQYLRKTLPHIFTVPTKNQLRDLYVPSTIPELAPDTVYDKITHMSSSNQNINTPVSFYGTATTFTTLFHLVFIRLINKQLVRVSYQQFIDAYTDQLHDLLQSHPYLDDMIDTHAAAAAATHFSQIKLEINTRLSATATSPLFNDTNGQCRLIIDACLNSTMTMLTEFQTFVRSTTGYDHNECLDVDAVTDLFHAFSLIYITANPVYNYSATTSAHISSVFAIATYLFTQSSDTQDRVMAWKLDAAPPLPAQQPTVLEMQQQ
jgi:hypothetical protein